MKIASFYIVCTSDCLSVGEIIATFCFPFFAFLYMGAHTYLSAMNIYFSFKNKWLKNPNELEKMSLCRIKG